jgi:hypothetical protein
MKVAMERLKVQQGRITRSWPAQVITSLERQALEAVPVMMLREALLKHQ